MSTVVLFSLISLPALAGSGTSPAAAEGTKPPPPPEGAPQAAVSTSATDGADAAGSQAPLADESIYVVQRRVYSKSGKLEITPLFFTSLNNKFVGHFGPGVAVAYHLRENLALEIQSTIPYVMRRFYSALVFEVYGEDPPLLPEVVDLKQLDYFGTLSVLFSGLYGKLEFYGWLIDYDFYVATGFGLVSTLETCEPNVRGCGDAEPGLDLGVRSPDANGDHFKLAGNLGAGARFFFSDFLGLRLEMRDIVFSDKAIGADGMTTTDIRSNLLFVAGLVFLL